MGRDDELAIKLCPMYPHMSQLGERGFICCCPAPEDNRVEREHASTASTHARALAAWPCLHL